MKLLAPCLCLLIVLGCGEDPSPPAAPAAGPVVAAVPPTADTLAKLAAADRLDGTEDKIVTLCPACQLHMHGKAQFSCQVGEYLVHGCSASCRDRVARDPNGLFAGIDVPEK